MTLAGVRRFDSCAGLRVAAYRRDTMQNGISTQDPEEMGHGELRSEWQDVAERLHNPPASHDLENALWDRRRELWNEMKSRVDVEPPECPECDGRQWSQEMGGPKVCRGCDLHLGMENEDLIAEIDDYWRRVKSGPQEEEA